MANSSDMVDDKLQALILLRSYDHEIYVNIFTNKICLTKSNIVLCYGNFRDYINTNSDV